MACFERVDISIESREAGDIVIVIITIIGIITGHLQFDELNQ